jgi:hypothetical protein
VNDKKIWALIETIHRADFYTVCVFTFDAVFAYYERHTDTSFIPVQRILAGADFENCSGRIIEFLF